MIHELEQALEHCLIRDRFPLINRIKKLKTLDEKKQQEVLAQLIKRVEKSQQSVVNRSKPVSLSYPENLPVSERREEILEAIKNHQVVVVAGETGSGKTTQLPKLCLEAGLGVYGRIGHTQPRRLAARAVAQRIADEMHSELGQLVGYQVRFSDVSHDDTRIKVMTDGILLAQTQNDRFLNEYDCLIIDEAHERSLNIDFLLGYLKQLLAKRPDLKLVITSATIDVDRFSKHFNNAPVIEVSGRTFPVEVLYRPLIREQADEEDRSLYEGISDALAELRQLDKQKNNPGDVLVFLPGEREIRECAEHLRKEHLPATEILPLYARLGASDQQKIFNPKGGRRVVLSTNVAETSLTVPGIRYVVDSGVARISRYSYRSKVQRLPIEPISQASANQRAGRCGRIEPGTCIRLYEEQDFTARAEFTDPEIQRTNLAAVILQMLNLKLGDIAKFPFLDAPDNRFVKDGYTLLQELQAVDEKRRLTQLGTRMSRLPLDPRVSRMILEAGKRGCINEVMTIASFMAIADPRERPQDKQQAAAEKHCLWADEKSDFISLVNLWNAFEEERQALSQNQLRKWCKKHFISYMRMREWRDTHRQVHILCRDLGIQDNSEPASYDAIHKSLLTGMLSHIGFHNEQKEFRGARNRFFFVTPGSAVYKKPPKWVMAAELVETSRLYGRTLATIEPEWIEECGRSLLKYQYFEPHWNQRRGQVTAYEQSSIYGLVVNPRKPVDYSKTHMEEARDIMILEGLVAQNMQSKVPFYVKNKALLKEVTEYEEKSRRRDLVLDDQALADFYGRSIPEHIATARNLESWYKKSAKHEQDALLFTREFLLSDSARGITNDDFPTSMEVNGVSYPLSYSFSPGAKDDGVTMKLPVSMLKQISEKDTDWLVPGFLHNKVVALLKGLPKEIRKQFVPVPDTAKDFLSQASSEQGGLLNQLAEYLNKTLRPKIEVSALSSIELEPHLQMNFQVVSGNKPVGQGRNLADLQTSFEEEGKEAVLDLTDSQYKRDNITDWDFGDLPISAEGKVAGLAVISYPCLAATKEGVNLTVENTSYKAEVSHREGLLKLIRQSQSTLEREVKQEVQKQLRPHWLMAKGMGSENSLTQDLINAAFNHVFLPFDEALPRTKADYFQRLDRRGELFAFVQQLLGLFVEWLTIRHKILKSLRGAVSMDKAMAFSDVKAHLERLLADGFVYNTPWENLKSFSRYLRAMEYRIDKLQGNLPRDRQSIIEFESLYKPWVQAMKETDAERHAQLVEFGWLLEEWRVSLFAQPLGTRVPVSLKRLEKHWAELKR